MCVCGGGGGGGGEVESPLAFQAYEAKKNKHINSVDIQF